jgi:hypothetical protein
MNGGRQKTTLGCLKDYCCFEAATEGCQQAGWRGDVPFFFFLISSGHEKECEREKVLLYPQAIHARPVIFFVFLVVRALQIWQGRRAAF